MFVNHIIHVIINFYVDNFLIFFKSMTVIKKFKNLLINKYNMKDLKSAKFILRIRIRREKNKIMIDQSFYIRNFLQKYKINKANSVFIFMINYDICNFVIVNEFRANQLKYQKRKKVWCFWWLTHDQTLLKQLKSLVNIRMIQQLNTETR